MTEVQSNSPDDRILLHAPRPADAAAIRGILNQARLTYLPCQDADEVCRELVNGAGAVILAEEGLDPVAMQRLAEILGRQARWSDVPVVVLFGSLGGTPEAGLRMLGLLEALGNVTVLEWPTSPITLASVLHAALRARHRQYQVRDLLEKRERLLERRERFLTLLAHELRDPLGVIRHAMQILDRVGAQTNVAIDQRAVVIRQTARLAHLVDDVVDVYRVLAGKVPLRRTAVDLRELASRCLQNLAAEANGPEHRVRLMGVSDPLVVEGDARRLGQVITHLLTNAIRHTPPGGRIDVNLSRVDDHAVLSVRDTGAGFSPDMLPRLFEQFEEVEETSDEAAPRGRLKMGLTLVYRLVELHGGSVSASSPGPGLGSEFVVRLPLAGAPAMAEPAQPPARAAGVPHRILVVEDNRDGREMLRCLLQLWGHQVEVAVDGPQGVQKALAWHPDVALVDIGLPGLDGYGVARQVRGAFGPAIHLAAMTGYGPPHDLQRAQEAGFDTLFVKPVPPNLLAEWLAAPAVRVQERV
jgi:signal transduction histidine kinase